MKKLLSLLLAAGMLASAYAPAVYAVDLPDPPATQDIATSENARPSGSTATASVELQSPAYLAATGEEEASTDSNAGSDASILSRLSFRVTAEGGTDFTSADPFDTLPIIVGKEYTFYPLLDGKPLSESGYTLKAAEIYTSSLDKSYLKVLRCNEAEGSLVLTATAASSGETYLGDLHLTLLGQGLPQQDPFFMCIGQTQAQTGRLEFLSGGAPVSTLTASTGNQTFTLSLSGMELDPDTMEIVYSSSVPDSVTITPDAASFGTVTLTVNRPVTSGNTFSATVKDKATGNILNTASVSLEWQEDISADTIGAYTICFGIKEDNLYKPYYSSDYSQVPGTDGGPFLYTDSMSVFFYSMLDDITRVYSNLPGEGSNATISVESLSDKLTIGAVTQPTGSDPFTFQYTLDLSECCTAQMKTTVTVDGTSYSALFTFHVNESSATDTVTVSSSEELTAALNGTSLLPGGTVLLEPGVYEGDFVAAIPVMITGSQYNGTRDLYDENGAILEDATAPVIQGSITATSKDVELYGLRFQATDTSSTMAVTDANVVSGCTFSGYDTALVLSKTVLASSNIRIRKNAFVGNTVALSFAGREWMSMIQENSFLNNGTAMRMESPSYIDGTYSNIYTAKVNSGKWSNNFFRGSADQKVLEDLRGNDGTTLLLNYNYFAYGDLTGAQDALFAGSACDHSVFYTTPALTSVSTEVSLTDLASQGGLDLVAQQQDTATADTALNVSSDLFDKLQADADANSLTLNVWTTDEKLAAVWDFPQNELTADATAQDVNLGVRDTLDADEQAVVDANLPADTDCQPIHFMHDGALPGTATVEVPLTETGLDTDNLALYYINEETGALEPTDAQVTVTDGMLSFDIEHCSSYIVVPGQKELTVTWPSDATFTYDGSEKSFLPTLNGVADGDKVEPVYSEDSVTAATKAGNYTVTLTGVNNNGYVLADDAQTTASWTIEKAAATDDMKKASGSMEIGTAGSVELNLPEGAVCGTPVYEGNLLQDLAVEDGKLTFTASDELVYGTTCTVTVPVTASDNYLAYDVTVALTTPERGTPQLSAQPLKRAYNGKAVTADEIPGKTAVYNGQTVAGSWTLESTAPKDAGTFTVTLRFTPDDSRRYTDATLTATGTIDPCPVTVQPSGANRLFVGDFLPTLSLSVTGLPENETLTVADAAFDGMPADSEKAGDYTITVQQSTREALEALPQAGNYTITYANLTLTILSDETEVLTEDTDYRLEKEPLQGIDGNSTLDTPEKVQSAMMQVLSTQLEEVSSQNTQLYDVTLYVKAGEIWEEATKEDFPADGLTLTLPYPTGLKDAASYRYTVLHLCDDGTMEQLAPANTAEGIQVTVHSLSPIAVSWAAAKQQESPAPTPSSAPATESAPAATATPTPAPGGSTVYYVCTACGYHNWTATEEGYRCDHCGYIESVKQLSGYGNVRGVYEPKTGSTPASGSTASSVVPATSDESHPMVWVVLLIVAGVAFAALLIYKKRQK